MPGQVTMRRPHLFEFLDQGWYPSIFRQIQTDYLRFAHTMQPGPHPAAALIAAVLRRTGTVDVVDLCSGGAGPWARLQRDLARIEPAVSVKLTDKYPRWDALRRAGAVPDTGIECVAESVDATAVPTHLRGMRTVFEGFHHFAPEQARAILADAAYQRVPIGVFEVALPRPLVLVLAPVLMLTTIAAYLVVTPSLKPRTIARFLWTYLLPVVPLATCWDGVVSLLRVYSPEELLELTSQLPRDAYTWEIGNTSTPVPGLRYVYLLAYPDSLPSVKPEQ